VTRSVQASHFRKKHNTVRDGALIANRNRRTVIAGEGAGTRHGAIEGHCLCGGTPTEVLDNRENAVPCVIRRWTLLVRDGR
jgi:hypothetical protein